MSKSQRQRQKHQILFENQNFIEGVPSMGCRSLKDKDKITKYWLKIKISSKAYLPWDVEVSKTKTKAPNIG